MWATRSKRKGSVLASECSPLALLAFGRHPADGGVSKRHAGSDKAAEVCHPLRLMPRRGTPPAARLQTAPGPCAMPDIVLLSEMKRPFKPMFSASQDFGLCESVLMLVCTSCNAGSRGGSVCADIDKPARILDRTVSKLWAVASVSGWSFPSTRRRASSATWSSSAAAACCPGAESDEARSFAFEVSKLCSLGAKIGIAKIWAGNAKEFKTRAATTDPSVELISARAECGESRCGRKQEIAPSHQQVSREHRRQRADTKRAVALTPAHSSQLLTSTPCWTAYQQQRTLETPHTLRLTRRAAPYLFFKNSHSTVGSALEAHGSAFRKCDGPRTCQ